MNDMTFAETLELIRDDVNDIKTNMGLPLSTSLEETMDEASDIKEALDDILPTPQGVYTKLQYIESTGTQFVALDFPKIPYVSNCTHACNLDFDVQFTSLTAVGSSQKYNLIGIGAPGAGNGGKMLYFGWYSKSGSTPLWYYSNFDSDMPTLRTANTNRHTFQVLTYSEGSKDPGFYVDGSRVTTNTPSVPASYQLRYAFIIPGYLNGDGMNYTKAKIYSAKISMKDVGYIYDLIPVKRNRDNEVGLYDKISKQFFTNCGTGTFVAGPVVAGEV